jgi:aldose 1-epimerase
VSLLLATLLAAAPAVSSAPYGVTAAGERVERMILRNARGMSVAILTYGGIIDEVRVRDRRGRAANVVLALPDLASHEKRANFGSLIGRYAGRISGGGFTLDGRRHPLPNPVTSHGGAPGFGARVWRAEPCATPGCSAVTLRYASADGENGFPGALAVAVTYTLTADDTLRLDYQATTTRPTVVNLTHHAYFNLGGGTSGSADGQYLRIPASHILELDERRVPTGALLPVAGTPFDLRAPSRIGDRVGSTHPQMRLARGFDHWFLLDRAKSPALAACAFDPASGRTLDVRSTAPGVQLYTANSFDGTLAGAGGRTIRQGDGYAIETQAAPDAPNRPAFASTTLRPGNTYRVTTTFRFGTAPSLAAFDRSCR